MLMWNTQQEALASALNNIKECAKRLFPGYMVDFVGFSPNKKPPWRMYAIEARKKEKWFGLIPKTSRCTLFLINAWLDDGPDGTHKIIYCSFNTPLIAGVVREEMEKYKAAVGATRLEIFDHTR